MLLEFNALKKLVKSLRFKQLTFKKSVDQRMKLVAQKMTSATQRVKSRAERLKLETQSVTSANKG